MKLSIRKTTAIVLISCILAFVSLAGCVGVAQQFSPTPSPAATATHTATPSPMPTPTPYHEIYPITFGQSTTSVYQNEYFGFQIDVGDRWFSLATQQYDIINSFPMEIPKDKRIQEYLKFLDQGGAVDDFNTISNTGLKMIDITISDQTALKALYPTMPEYHEVVRTTLRQALQDGGARFITDELTTTIFAGREQSCWFFSYEMDGYIRYNAQVILRERDYGAIISLSSIGTDRISEMLALFLPLNDFTAKNV